MSEETVPNTTGGKRTRTWSILSRVSTHPITTGTSFVFGAVGVILSVLFYYWSVRSPEIVVSVNPIRSIIEPPAHIDGLKLVWLDRPLQGPASILQVAIWNRGRSPVRSEDILEQVELMLPDSVEVLQAIVLRTVRPVSNVEVETHGKNVASIRWRILEQSDGALIQLVVVGAGAEVVTVHGAIVGQGAPQVVRGSSGVVNVRVDTGMTRSSWWLMVSIAVLVPVAMTIAQWKWRTHRKAYDQVFMYFFAAIWVITWTLVFVELVSAATVSPFGF